MAIIYRFLEFLERKELQGMLTMISKDNQQY
jgi:hypothetical protein